MGSNPISSTRFKGSGPDTWGDLCLRPLKELNLQHYYSEHRTHAGSQGQPPVTGGNAACYKFNWHEQFAKVFMLSGNSHIGIR